jgi:hypothetical protein
MGKRTCLSWYLKPIFRYKIGRVGWKSKGIQVTRFSAVRYEAYSSTLETGDNAIHVRHEFRILNSLTVTLL